MRIVRSSVASAMLVAYLATVSVIAAPVVLEGAVRRAYVEDLAVRRAHLIAPDYLMLGDSLTAGGAPWGSRLSYDPLSAVTRAQPGSTTALIANLTEPASWGFRPRFVSLLSGTNDVGSGRVAPARFAADQIANIDRLLGSGARVVLTLIPPTADAARNRRTIAFNRALVAALGTRPVTVIDLWPALARGDAINPRYTVDGIHFTPAAYAIWATRLRAVADPPRNG